MAASFDITFNVKEIFFDRPAVQNAVDRQQRAAISKSLAFVRRRARSSLRRRKKVSEPGGTPSVHTKGDGLKKIFFAYDQRTGGGVVGPVRLNQVNLMGRSSKPVTAIMEFGGVVGIQEIAYPRSEFGGGGYFPWRRRDLRRRLDPKTKRRKRNAKYAPRPFMVPALEKEVADGNVLSPWANVVGG